jgi:hypothetical protein
MNISVTFSGVKFISRTHHSVSFVAEFILANSGAVKAARTAPASVSTNGT